MTYGIKIELCLETIGHDPCWPRTKPSKVHGNGLKSRMAHDGDYSFKYNNIDREHYRCQIQKTGRNIVC